MLIIGLAVGALIGIAAGALCAWNIARTRWQREVADIAAKSGADIAATSARLDEWSKQFARLDSELAQRTRELEQSQAESAAVRHERVRLAAELDAERKSAAEKLALLQEAEAKLREAFEALSAEALRRNNQSFLELAKTSLGEFQKTATGDLEKRQQAISELVKPIRESLEKVDSKLQDVEKARIEAYAALGEQVRSLSATQQNLQSETANLVKALRTPSVRGRWGEIQLRRVVEMAGMVEHCDFHEQQTASNEDGRFRPDLVVRLPGGKRVVVDAKAPLMAYLEALETSDDAAREALLRDHARQVREHISRLSAKAYWGQFEPTPEFVVMFLPGETFFSAALQHDPALIEFGVEQSVIPASPTTLIALLRAVAYGWRQERIAESAQAISKLGRELYERLQVMAGHFDEMGRHLDRTIAAYNKTVGSFESRVLVGARRFKELGATTGADLPELTVIDRTPRALQPPPGTADDVPAGDPPPAFLTERRDEVAAPPAPLRLVEKRE